MRSPVRSARSSAHLWLGLSLWLAWFGAVYSGVAIACRAVPAPSEMALGWINGAVLLATLAMAVPLAVAAWVHARRASALTPQERGDRTGFLVFASAALYAIAALATLVVGLPAVLLPACV